MNPKQYLKEFDKLGTLAESDANLKILRGQVNNSADVPAALGKVRSAQAKLTAVRTELQKQRNLAERAVLLAKKAGLTEKVALVQLKIQQITAAITTVESIASKVASIYASAGSSLTITNEMPAPTESINLATRGQTMVKGVQANRPTGPISGVVGWIVNAHYAPEITSLSKKIAGIDVQIGNLDTINLQLDMSQAISNVNAVQGLLDSAKEGLKSAVAGKRSRVHDLGAGLDQLRMKDSPRTSSDIGKKKDPGDTSEVTKPNGAARATALLDLGQAVIEFTNFLKELNKQLTAMPDGPALLGRIVNGVSSVPGVRFSPGDQILLDCFKRHGLFKKDFTGLMTTYEKTGSQWAVLLGNVIPNYKP